jgi:predicted DNA-binding transcriptional regulator YafY
MPPVIQQEISEGIFQQLNQAITNHIVVKVKYKAASDGKVSVRVLEPMYLFSRGNNWGCKTNIALPFVKKSILFLFRNVSAT